MIINAECLSHMKTMESNSISAIVTDPPYGLKFMGKEWDHGIPGVEFWKEALRISKPGTWMLAFGGTRTYHRLTCAIEDAGWEIRDCIMWMYGSGFPKSHNFGKSIDNHGGNPAMVKEIADALKKARESRKLSIKYCDDRFCRGTSNYSWFEGRPAGVRLPPDEIFCRIINEWDELRYLFEKVKKRNREIIETQIRSNSPSGIVSCGRETEKIERNITLPFSDLAKEFDGYGTALKPAYEPIIMAMKPLDGTFAQNAEKYGLAGINIDECRVGTDDTRSKCSMTAMGQNSGWNSHNNREVVGGSEFGRWPANIILDEEASLELGDKARYFYCPKASSKERNEGLEGMPLKDAGIKNDSGRGFSESDPMKIIQYKNHHPCVKPLALMEYLIKLIMPPSGILLDPFAGSGTTILAAKRLGVEAIGIELNEEYCEIARNRLDSIKKCAGQDNYLQMIC